MCNRKLNSRVEERFFRENDLYDNMHELIYSQNAGRKRGRAWEREETLRRNNSTREGLTQEGVVVRRILEGTPPEW